MIGRYQQLFQAKNQHFVIAGLLARLALPMMGIGIITLLAQLKGVYLGGACFCHLCDINMRCYPISLPLSG